MIMKEQSPNASKDFGSRNFSDSKFINSLSRGASGQKKFEEFELMLLDNMDTQPDDKVARKRKTAAQYTPYGVFSKQAGGFGKTIPKFYVRPDLMFYSKYDKRLLAEVIKEDKKSKKNKLLRKSKKVLILAEEGDQATVCPISINVVEKRTTPEEVFSIGKEIYRFSNIRS